MEGVPQGVELRGENRLAGDPSNHEPILRDASDRAARESGERLFEGLRSVREDLEQNFRSVLQASLSKLDLVTREEFEVQEAVLAKTREKVEKLEELVKELEKD